MQLVPVQRFFVFLFPAFACSLGLLAPIHCLGQQSPQPPAQTAADGLTPAADTPGSPAGSYELSGFDTVNIPNGRASFTFPVADAYGRGGAKIPIVIHAEGQWTISAVPNCGMGGSWCNANSFLYLAEYGPRSSVGVPPVGGVLTRRTEGAFCSYTTGAPNSWWDQALTVLYFTAPDGTETEFVDVKTGGAVKSYSGYGTGYDRGSSFRAMDGSGTVVTTTSDVTDPIAGCPTGSSAVSGGTMILRDGTKYTFDQYGFATQIEDRNGNLIGIQEGTAGNNPTTVTDALGRSVVYTPGAGNVTITYPGANGVVRTVTATTMTASNATFQDAYGATRGMFRSGFSLETGQQLFPTFATGGGLSGNFPVEIKLPDGNAYELYYDSYGNVARVELPTGGAYEYDYSVQSFSVAASIPQYANVAPLAYTVIPYITEKRSYATTSSTTPVQVICYSATDPTTVSYNTAHSCPGSSSLGTEVHTFTSINTTPPINQIVFPGWLEGKESQVAYNNSSSTLLKTDSTSWQQRPCSTNSWDPPCWYVGTTNCSTITGVGCPLHDPQMASESTAYNTATTGSVNDQKSYAYDQYNNRTSLTEYGYGNGAPSTTATRTTLTCYDGSQVTSACPNGASYSTYTALTTNILNLPVSESIYSGTGTGSAVAQTTWTYDATAPVACATITEHDSNYSISFTSPRGNATSIVKLWYDSINNDNSTLTTTQVFDLAGNMTASVDPRGVRKDISYQDSSGHCALPVSMIHYTALNPAANPSCAITTAGCFVETLSYDFNLGKPSAYKDFNGNSTTYGYADSLDRLTKVTRPDTGQTNYTYSDVAPSFSTTSKQDQATAADGVIVSEVIYDGLGRKAVSEYSAPEGEIETCYAYDGKNRTYSVSNANVGSCSSSLITYTYDVLDRILTSTAPDNSVTSYIYHGDTTNLTNDKLEIEPPLGLATNGNNRLSYSDALGRLLEVDENATSWAGGSYGQSAQSTYTTTYGYDVLDDLTAVTQGTQTPRAFTYDSLKRLVQGVNPESGTIKYSYDNSGNLATRTDARIVSGTTNYKASYSFDGLNRMTAKSYADSITPSIYFTWDAGGSAQNANGRLTSTQAYLASSYWYYNRSYDIMGRVSASSEDVPCGANCGTTTHPQYFCNTYYFCYAMSYAYNLASDVTSFTFPSGRVQKNVYDSANRFNNVQDTYNSNTSIHASSIGYAPNGTLDSMVIGHPTFSGNNMTENTTLNTLWQITNRNLQIGSAFPVTLGFTYGAAAKNNGNLTQQTIVTTAAPNPPPGVSIPAVNLTQTYGYDAYDRLLSAAETGGTAPEWAQTYLYDQFGNRAVQTSGSYIPNPNGTPTATAQFTNNRWTSATYDAAGDEITVPGSTSETFTYDGEYRAYTANANGTITYNYDGEGRRVQKTASTFQVNYVYDASGKEIMESTIPGTGFPTEAPYTGTEYLIPDHLGSSRLAINGQGQVVHRYDFLPFGEELKAGTGGRGADYEPSTYSYPTTPDDVTRKFTGKDRDWETGLDFFGARYMSNAQGRFTSSDEYKGGGLFDPETGKIAEAAGALPYADINDPETLNKYGYTRNNPLRYTDPDGHCPAEDAACSKNLSVQQVTSIIFNETQSLHGKEGDLDAMRQDVAHAIINGDNKLGERRPATAPDEVGAKAGESLLFHNIENAVECACKDAASGKDPTNGATHFNLRANQSAKPFQGSKLQTQSAGFKNSYPSSALPGGSDVHVNTYKEEARGKKHTKNSRFLDQRIEASGAH